MLAFTYNCTCSCTIDSVPYIMSVSLCITFSQSLVYHKGEPMTISLVPTPVTVDLDADLFSALSDAQLGLYMRLVWLCRADSSGIALIMHGDITPVRLAELQCPNFINCSFRRSGADVTITTHGPHI